MANNIEIAPYREFLKSIGGKGIAKFLKSLDRDKLEPLLLLNEFNRDWRFIDKMAHRAQREFAQIDNRYTKLLSRFGLSDRLFETNCYYDSNGERYCLPFWKNENALTDIVVSAIINNRNFWKNFYKFLFKRTKKSFAPPIGTLSVKREKFYQYQIEDENGETANGKKGRSDIFISYANQNGSMEHLHVEHKIQHKLASEKNKLDSPQIHWYCQSASESEYEHIFFILITCKDEDKDLLYARDGRLVKKIESSYSSGPIIMSHVDLMRIFFNTIVVDPAFSYQWVIPWLFEIIKNYRNERIIKENINRPVSNEASDEVWEKLLMLNILEGLENGQK